MKKLIVMVALAGMTLMATAAPALAAHSVYLGTSLSGAAEVGDPGDLDATGSATITIVNASSEICYSIAVNNADAPSAAHIHIGGAGSNGDVVVDLDYGTNGAAGCVPAPIEIRAAIENAPTLYYVNVHNAAFPGGAVRGQLATVAASDTTAPATGGQELAFTDSNLTGLLALAGAGLVASGALMVRTSRKED